MNLTGITHLGAIGLNTRLISGFCAMVALAFVCGLLGVYMADQFKKETTAMLEGPVAEIAQANAAWEGILGAQNAQLRFSQTKNAEQIARFDQAVADARDALTNIEQSTSNAQWKVEIEHAKSDLVVYEQLFHEFYDLSEQRGLSEKLGLEGELRSAVHKVEEDLMQSGYDELTVLLLMCRRHEKDYLMRGDREKYLGRIDQRLSEFDEAVARMGIDAEAVAAWDENWGVYRDAIHSLADKRDEIAGVEADFLAKNAELGDRLTTILETAPQIDTSAVDRAKSISLITLGVVLVVGGVMAAWLIRSITAPLARITTFA